MLASGFTNAPVSKALLFGLVGTSIAASLTDTKHYFYINVVPHFWPYRQLWRIGIWQIPFTASPPLLFALLTLYHMRTIERLWGPRKFASFLAVLYPLTSFAAPFLLAVALRPLSFGVVNTLPSGPVALVFALLAQYAAAIPSVYKWRVVTGGEQRPGGRGDGSGAGAGAGEGTAQGEGSGGRGGGEGGGEGGGRMLDGLLTFSDKTTTYLLAGQLALSQLPGSLVAALVGYGVGIAYRNGLLPERLVEWRLPAWIVGGSGSVGRGDGENFEGLRRRLEGEGRASGIETSQGESIRAR